MLKWLILSDIPAHGRDFSFEEKADWENILQEHGVQYDLQRPMVLNLHVQPQSDGFLLSGSLEGAVSLPCERCLQPVEVEASRRFQVFEELPAVTDAPLDSLLRETSGHLELNIRHMMWEQFNLSLPAKVLCSPECNGLCPHCGQDLNQAACACSKEGTDPRMAVFRQIKIF
ncbi:MAG: YceD family protein [Desulfonatronovibrionaceae bacterium]